MKSKNSLQADGDGAVLSTSTYRSHIGLHYTDQHGFRRVSMQLLGQDGKAVATAEFVNYGKVNRPCISCQEFRTTDEASLAAVEWKNGLLRAPISEMLASVESKGAR